jgi:hypothetical protein
VTLALLPGGFQLAVAFRVDLLLTPRQHVLRRDVAGGTVQADVVVMLHVALDQTPCTFQRQRRSRPNALAFQRLVPALNLAVGVSRQLRHYETLKDNDSVSFILIIPGTDVSLNCCRAALNSKNHDFWGFSGT